MGSLSIPMVSDGLHSISKDYGVYLSNMGVSLRGLIIIDGNGIVRQITMNDLPVGRSVDETLRLVKAFQVKMHSWDLNRICCILSKKLSCVGKKNRLIIENSAGFSLYKLKRTLHTKKLVFLLLKLSSFAHKLNAMQALGLNQFT